MSMPLHRRPPGARRLALLREPLQAGSLRETGQDDPSLQGVHRGDPGMEADERDLGVEQRRDRSDQIRSPGVPRPGELHHDDHARPSWHRSVITLGKLTHESGRRPLRQYLDTGDRVSLRLSWAYLFSLVVLAGYGASFPGVLGTHPPLDLYPSTSPWLWVTWHTGFPVLLAVALTSKCAPSQDPAPLELRRRALWTSIVFCSGAGARMREHRKCARRSPPCAHPRG